MARFLPSMVVALPLVLMSVVTADEQLSGVARIQSIKRDVADAETAWQEARAMLPDSDQDDPRVNRLREIMAQKQRDGMAGALEIARADPQSKAGFEALEWLLLNAPAVYYQPAGKPALELMSQYHATNPQIGRAIARIAYLPPYGHSSDALKAVPAYRPAMELLRLVAEKNPDRVARGQAVMELAWQAKRSYRFAADKAFPEAARYQAEAERAFESVIKDYGDCLYQGMYKGEPSKSTLEKLARSELVELRDLQPGRLTPEIRAEDLAGATF
jgi:hypothetical protein